MSENYHEELMSQAYKKFGNKTIAEFYQSLPEIERAAAILGNLNYQVENGGFMQWHDNRYGAAARPFIGDILSDIGTDIAEEVYTLVIKSYKVNDGLEKLLKSCNYEDDDINFASIDGQFDVLDKAYYKLNEKFMAECLKYLTENK